MQLEFLEHTETRKEMNMFISINNGIENRGSGKHSFPGLKIKNFEVRK